CGFLRESRSAFSNWQVSLKGKSVPTSLAAYSAALRSELRLKRQSLASLSNGALWFCKKGECVVTDTRVADLTVDDLRKLIRETVLQTLSEVLSDPDEGLELRDEFKLELERALAVEEKTSPAHDVAARFGLTW
ncbi:MAG: hypothetical protein N3D16_10410, partial [Anaerolineales bacterium]|nr:hypothetical protein [Anaerolineales bacterium]